MEKNLTALSLQRYVVGHQRSSRGFEREVKIMERRVLEVFIQPMCAVIFGICCELMAQNIFYEPWCEKPTVARSSCIGRAKCITERQVFKMCQKPSRFRCRNLKKNGSVLTCSQISLSSIDNILLPSCGIFGCIKYLIHISSLS